MTLAEVLASLFRAGHEVREEGGLISGRGPRVGGGHIHVLGVAGGTALGIDHAMNLAGKVLAVAGMPDDAPILVLIDSGSQRMTRRDELVGLNEYLAHLAKSLILAELNGHRTVGLLYGHSAAGALVATGLAAGLLVALPGATPAVMDLPSMARVTKLPLDALKRMSDVTPVFAPGLDNLAKTGAVREIWSSDAPLDVRLAALLGEPADTDVRDRLGQERKGRPKAAAIAARVMNLAALDV